MDRQETSTYNKRYYELNKEKFLAANKKRRDRLLPVLRAIIIEAKDVPCADCGNRFPPVAMDFDHVRGEKKGNISTMVNVCLSNPEKVKEEIAKCEVVCACCHRIRTALRGEWYASEF